MTEANTAADLRHRTSFSLVKKNSIRIDMTPMVDLGFLLITFFIYTTTISNPTVTNLIMPDDTPVTKPNNLPESLSLSVLLDDNNRIYYYHGKWEDAVKKLAVYETGFSYSNGIGEVIRQKQKAIDASGKFNNGRKEMMLIIKPGQKATYQNVIDALDEVMINDVKKYAIVTPEKEGIKYISNLKN